MVNPREFERLRKLARGLSPDAGEDLVQDTYLAALEDPGGRTHTRSYLGQAIGYRWRMRMRSEGRRRAREAAYATLHSGGDPAELAVISLAIRQALERLSADERELLEARFVEGREPREIAETLGVSSQAARQRIHRALGQLRAEFDDTMPRRRTGLAALLAGSWPRWILVGSLGLSLAGLLAWLAWPDPPERDSTTEPVELAGPRAAKPRAKAPPPAPEPRASEAVEPPGTSAATVSDRLAVAHMLREHREAYARLMKEVQGSFIECLREHNSSAPAETAPLTGRSEFRVHMRHDPDTGSFAERVEVVEDEASARELATCIRESLPTIRFEDPTQIVPPRFRVILDLDHRRAFAASELDLSGLPESMVENEALLNTLSAMLSGKTPAPEGSEGALARFAAALADGTVTEDELDADTLARLQAVLE